MFAIVLTASVKIDNPYFDNSRDILTDLFDYFPVTGKMQEVECSADSVMLTATFERGHSAMPGLIMMLSSQLVEFHQHFPKYARNQVVRGEIEITVI